MSQARKFDWDIFISYPRESDQRGAGDLQWVTEFHRLLKLEIQERTSGDVRIFFDQEQFKSSDHLWDHVLEAARKSFIFVPILTPRYIAPGKFTLKELDAFCTSGDVKGRIVTVELIPVNDAERPPVLNGPKRNPFYKIVKDREIKLGSGDNDHHYYTNLQIIAADISSLLKSQTTDEAPAGGKTAWLAEKPEGLSSEWERVRSYLKNELQLRILPESDYPSSEASLRQEATEDIKAADIFVQLLSPEDESIHREENPEVTSRGQVQSDIAKTECKRRNEDRLLQWRKPGRQGAYKHWNTALLNANEVLSGSLAEFENAIAAKIEDLQQLEQQRLQEELRKQEQQKIQQGSQIVGQSPASGDSELRVLLINAAKEDLTVANELMERVCSALANNTRWTVKRVPLEGSPMELEEALDGNLAACDAVWLIYGNSFSTWVDQQLLRCQKIAAVRKKVPLTKDKRAILLVPPERDRDIIWSKKDNVLVDLQRGISETQVEQLINTLP